MTPLETILNKKNSAPRAAAVAESCLPQADRIALAEPLAETPQGLEPAETIDASPSTCPGACQACGSPLFWLARLPTEPTSPVAEPSPPVASLVPRLRCAGCRPPPSPIFVSGWLLVVLEDRQWKFEDWYPAPQTLGGAVPHKKGIGPC